MFMAVTALQAEHTSLNDDDDSCSITTDDGLDQDREVDNVDNE